MHIEYAIKIGTRYFKSYVYYEKSKNDRYAGNTGLGIRLQEGDIIDVITTESPERIETKRSIGNTIAVLYSIDKLKDKTLTIVPITKL